MEELQIQDYSEENYDVDLSSQRTIRTQSSDSEVFAMYTKYKKGRLNVQPDYQRKYVWDSKKASLLIESILLGIPIPLIYLADEGNGVINVIDGQQRLTSLFSFIDGSFPDGKKFKLTGMNVFTELKGKTFAELDGNLQDKINEYPLRVITFTSDSDPDLQYEIFSRLNTGSVALNDQELRNCIYRGRFNEFIKELALDKEFQSLLGLKAPHTRMKDVELVLRFVGFYTESYINYMPPSKKFMNEVMRKNRNADDTTLRKIREAFKKAVLNTKTLLGDKAFRRFVRGTESIHDGKWDTNTLNVSLYEILMDSMARIDTPVLMRHLDAIREAYINMVSSNEDFINSITRASADKNAVTTRFRMWTDVVDSIKADDKLDARCFSLELKQKLYDQNPTCAICGQHISSIDDCHVDHIEQYWRGGKTIPENARLTHRYCNCARPKND
ncbi:MAG: DUF262 domain-containing protein [Bacteroidaceae bacterium]|nr:DUF262 domain-containing protein [Bacteroidaceae bacterium]